MKTVAKASSRIVWCFKRPRLFREDKAENQRIASTMHTLQHFALTLHALQHVAHVKLRGAHVAT